MTSTNAQRFLDAFALIEQKLSSLCRETKYVPFAQLLSRTSHDNPVVSSHLEVLRQYGELRNAIVHQRGPEAEVIAEPSDAVTADIEHILELLDKEESILSYASRPVKTLKPTDSVLQAFELMKELGTSKLPVYSDEKYIGLVTLEEIAQWGMQRIEEDTEVRNILTGRKNEKVLFLSVDTGISEPLKAFQTSLNNGTTLLAVLITEHGRVNEIPQGIITVADLPYILNSFI